MAAVHGMYGGQDALSAVSAVAGKEVQPSVVIRELNASHADFILENADMR